MILIVCLAWIIVSTTRGLATPLILITRPSYALARLLHVAKYQR